MRVGGGADFMADGPQSYLWVRNTKNIISFCTLIIYTDLFCLKSYAFFAHALLRI